MNERAIEAAADVEAAAKVIRQRCCRAADGRDIREVEGREIARDVLRAALAAAQRVADIKSLNEEAAEGEHCDLDYRPDHRVAGEDGLRAALEAVLPYADNSDSPGGCDGKHPDCPHCAAIALARAALALSPGKVEA